MSDAPTSSPPPKKRRRFRWYTRLLLILVSLVLAIVVIAQILFWTDYPRRIVQSQIGGILHVDAKLGSLKIGWLGDVAVRDLSLQLPTESEPFLSVERADLKLAALPLLIVDQEVHRLAASGVDLRVREVAPNRFNLQQLLPPSSPEPSATPSQPTDPAKILAQLPSVNLDRVKASITRLNGKTLAFDDIRAALDTDRPLTRTFAASVDDVAKVDGKVAVLSSAPHELNITLDRVPRDLAQFIGTEIPAASAKLHWKGRVASGGVAGSLVIDRAAAENLAAAAGQIDVATQNDAIVVRPVGLTLTVAPDPATTRPTTEPTTQPTTKPAGPIVLTLDVGTIRAADQVRVERLRGTLDLGDAKAGHFAVDGTFDPASFDGELNAAWDSLTRAALATTGTLHATSKRDFTGKLIAAANVETRVALPTGTATAKLDVNAAGEALDNAVVDFHVEPLDYAAAKGAAIVGPELRGRIVAKGSAVELTELRTVGDASAGTLLVRGRADRGDKEWSKADAWLTVDARRLALPLLESFGLRGPIDADANLWREGSDFVVDSLYARWNGATLWSRGAYRTTNPKPLLLDTWAWYPATAQRPTLDPDEISVGDLVARGTVGGALGGPMGGDRYVEATLNVVGNDVSIQHKPIGDVTVDVIASIDEDSVDVRSREIALFGGDVTLAGTYLLAGTDPLRATLDLKGIDVSKLAQAGGVDGARGAIDEGHFNVEVPPTFALSDIRASGQVRGTSLAKDALEAEAMTASVGLENNTLRVVPILRQGEGTLDAELVADVTLAKPATLAFDLKNWPAPAAAATTRAATQAAPDEPAATRPAVLTRATAKGTATALFRDVPSTQPVLFPPLAATTQPVAPPPSTKRLETTLQMDASVDRDGQTLATLAVGARSTGAVFALDRLDAKTLDGTLNATARVDLDDVNGVTLKANFDRLAPAALAWANPLIGEVRGRFSGDVTVGPAAGARPLGRIAISANVAPTPDAGFRSVALGPISFRGFGDVESFDKYRVVTDTAEIHVADGVVKPFGRYSFDRATGPSQLVTVKFENLDLDQLTRVAIDDGEPIVGRLAGKLRVFGPATSLDTLNGEADVSITQSDLANFKPVAALYDIMNIGRGGKQPIGTGEVSARIEAGTLTLVDATYFNRGVFANAFGNAKEVDKINEAPLDLYLVGTLQPLKQSGSGLFAQIFGTANDALAALQGNATTLHVTGTLKRPKIEQVALSELGGAVKSLILGKSK